MIEPNDRVTRDVKARSRRRKGAGWKSGLMLTGMGAVVLGAGYLAGVNAPAVAQTGTPQALAQTTSPQAAAGQNQQQSPGRALNSDNGQAFEFNGDNGQAVGGNDDFFQPFQGSDDSGSTGQFNQQAPQQQFGRRSRQFGGSSQQQPGFTRPRTRSRGS